MRFERTIACKDSLDRPRATEIKLDVQRARVTVTTPVPAGSFDEHELDELIAALQAARGLLPGGQR